MVPLPDPVIKRIQTLGFGPYGIVDLDALDGDFGDGLAQFVAHNFHGTMQWMNETQARRRHPHALWPQARSALVLGINYGPDCDPLANLSHPERGNISVYARGRDYHSVIKGKLKEIAGLLARETSDEVKVFVDTAPLMEKPLAAQAGIGWQGKHTNLVSEAFGSWLFLGVIMTTATLTPTPRRSATCGTCRACLDICPTDAFPAPYQLDARKCISYLSIEHSGPVALEMRSKLGNRIYGCDDCLAVCPWNKYASRSSELKLVAREDLIAPNLKDLAALDEPNFRTLFAGTAIKRIGHARFLRNVLYAIGNSQMPSLAPSARQHTHHSDPGVQDAARWAVQRLQTGAEANHPET